MNPSVGKYCKDNVFPGLRITAAIRIPVPEREIATIRIHTRISRRESAEGRYRTPVPERDQGGKE